MWFKFRCTKSRDVGKETGSVVNTAVWHLAFQKNRSSQQFNETKQVVEIKEADLISHKFLWCMINIYLHLFAEKPVWRSDQGAWNCEGHALLTVPFMKWEWDFFSIRTQLLKNSASCMAKKTPKAWTREVTQFSRCWRFVFYCVFLFYVLSHKRDPERKKTTL